jgi:starch phosphorylase
MAELAPQFSANRMLREYVQTYYLGAAEAVRRRTADHCAVAQDLLEWQRSLGNRWTGIRFEEARIESDGTSYRYEVRCRLGELDPASVAVELYADARGARTTERHAMERTEVLDGGVALYRTVLDSSRDAHDYTPRAIPRHADAIVPLEAAEIVWQR